MYACICVPEPHRQSWAWGQTWRLSHPLRLFLVSVQLGLFCLRSHLGVWQKEKETKSNASGVVHVCETVPVCLHVHDHVSYDVLPLPVAPMIAFIPGLMIPLQQPTRKSSQHFDNLEWNLSNYRDILLLYIYIYTVLRFTIHKSCNHGLN